MEKRYKLAQRLLDFATVTIKKHSTDDIRRMLVINRVLAYKWGGEEKTATSILKDEDWSATASKYKLAETVLRGDFEAAARMMKKIGKDDEEINVASYKLWPLFRDFRDSPIFLQAFEEVFGLPFNVIDSPTDTVHELENKLATLEETIEEDSTLLDDTETSSDVVDKD